MTGILVAENLALHRPAGEPSRLGRKTSLADSWDLSQISSGLRVGRFRAQEAAVFYAGEAVRRCPSLATGEPLTLGEASELAQLRQDCGGRQY